MSERLEMFDGLGRYCEPSAEAIAALEPEQREHFEAVRLAAQEREAAAAATKAAQAKVTQCVADLRDAENELRRVRPPISAVEAARAAMCVGK